jgi:type IV secretory system conjugative DNA transfer VirD4/TraG family protein
MQTSATVPSSAHFIHSPPIEPSPDSMSVSDPDGKVIRLPAYAKGALPITLLRKAPFEIKAQSLFTNPDHRSDALPTLTRFSIRVVQSGQTVFHRRYSAHQTSLAQALAIALRWISVRRRQERWQYICSWPLLSLWTFSIALGWLFEPIVGWFSFLPLFAGLPFSFYLAPKTSRSRQTTASIGGFNWERNDFCRGWLITGDTGAGKTFAINALLHSVFQHEPDWGGLCCDEKGIYHETLVRMAGKYNRANDLLLLQTRPDHAEEDWVPPARFNLLSNLTIPWSTYATVIVDTAAALASGTEDKGFFKTQAHANIGRGIQLFRLLNLVPTMHHLLEVLQYQPVLKSLLQHLESLKNQGHPDARECYDHFLNAYLRQPPEQLGGVISTIYNYLNYFTNPDIVQVFGPGENSFDFSALDDGAIICLSMPQKYQTERRYITTILKLLFYTHVLRRFDPRPATQRPVQEDNLLICWQDEAQRFITESDANVDVIRQASATTVMAAQSKLSFFPALGTKDKAEVTMLNLRNRIIFKAADKSCAEGSADFIGKRMHWKKSYTRGKGGRSTTRSREEEYLVKPFELMSLPKFTAIIKHCERGFRKRTIHPVDPEGNTPAWYPFWKRFRH